MVDNLINNLYNHHQIDQTTQTQRLLYHQLKR